MSGGRTVVGALAKVACRWCGELYDCFVDNCGCGIESYAQKREYEAWVAGGRQGEWRPTPPVFLPTSQKLLK
jgi:hypothetical protein